MIPWGGFAACASPTWSVFEVPSDTWVAADAGPAKTAVAAPARMSALIAVMWSSFRGLGSEGRPRRRRRGWREVRLARRRSRRARSDQRHEAHALQRRALQRA